MTVGRMRAEMSEAEFVEWSVFLGRRAQREQLQQQMARHRKG